ncbi:hypothetical protein [Variovorax sp.]|uniref:hypothetical protein n=1 Tax=Variovorax TaxID=34072 RepID=UPI00155E3367|nr:hypothetical protein [Variovorax sp.]
MSLSGVREPVAIAPPRCPSITAVHCRTRFAALRRTVSSACSVAASARASWKAE